MHDRTGLAIVAFAIAGRDKLGAPEKHQAQIVDELREWCQRAKIKVSADSTLKEIVSVALRVKAELKKTPL